MIIRKQIVSIFPTPVYYSKLNRKFTQKESNFWKKNKYRSNDGNITSVDNYVLNNKILKNIKKEIELRLKDFMDKIIQPKTNVKLYISQSWFNTTSQNQFHHLHSHPNSYLSGVLYFDADPRVDKIFFNRKQDPKVTLKVKKFNAFNSKSWWYPIQVGDIIIFPSFVPHYVAQKQNDENNKRCSLAFNTFLKGTLGDPTRLTELIL